MKKKKIVKRTNVPMYPRVSKINRDWFRSTSKKVKQSESKTLDRLLSFARTMKVSELKLALGHAKAGN